MREVHTEAPSRVFPLVSATRMQDITQRGELWGVGQGFVTCHRAGIAGDSPRLDSTRARHSGGGSGAALTSLRCRVLPPGAAMLLAPELNDAPRGALSGVMRARHPYLPELQSAARSGQDWA